MQFIGFEKAHHSSRKELKSNILKETPSFESLDNTEEYRKVLNFLKVGVPFAVEPKVVKSIFDDKLIDGLSYYTDMYWIWPSYFNYYLEQGNVRIPTELLDFINLSEEEKNKFRTSDMNLVIDFHSKNFTKFISSL